MEESRYAQYVIHNPYTQFERDGRVQFKGFHCTPEQLGVPCQYLYSVVKKAHVNESTPHLHQFPVIMNFFGGLPDDIRDFDAEIWFYLGGERQIITTPATVVIPSGVAHCPLIFTRVTKPVAWVEIMLCESYEREELDIPLTPDPGDMLKLGGQYE